MINKQARSIDIVTFNLRKFHSIIISVATFLTTSVTISVATSVCNYTKEIS